MSHKQVRNIRSLNSRSLPIPLVVPLGGTGQLRFEVIIFFPPKQQIRFFLPGVKGMSDVAGRNVWMENMAALGAQGESSGEPPQTADHHGMAAIANLQPLPAAASASPAVTPTVGESSKFPRPRGVGLSIGPSR